MTHTNPPPEQNHLLDGLLDELLGRQAPTVPSFESLLRRDSNKESNSPSRFTPQEIENALFAAQRDRSYKTATKASDPKSQRHRNPWLVWSSIAAALLGVSLVLWRDPSSPISQTKPSASGSASNHEIPSQSITNITQDQQRTHSPASDSPKNAIAQMGKTGLGNTGLGNTGLGNTALGNTEQKSIDPTMEASKIASMPNASPIHTQTPPLSAPTRNNPARQNKPTPQSQTADLPDNRLGTESDRNIIAVIDHQFEDMWRKIPNQKASIRSQAPSNAIDRMAQYLLSRPANPTELEAMRQANLLGDKEGSKYKADWIDAVAGRWINSEEFARQWAKRLSNFYRGEYPIRSDQLERAKAFELWLAGRIHEDTSLSTIQTEVLEGLWKAEHPARFLVDHWTELAARSSARRPQAHEPGTSQASRSPQSWVELPERQHVTLTGLTHLFLRITDNTNLACAQCHQKSGNLAGQPMPSANVQPSVIPSIQDRMNEDSLYAGEQYVRTEKTAKPIALGSIAALLVGIIEPERKELFTRDAEDRLIKLLPVNPDGTRIAEHQSRADAMAQWAQRGSHSQRGPINALWKSFFGVHLVRPSERFATSQPSSRHDLLEFLSQQSTAHNASLRQLAYWMLHSAPTRQPDVSLVANDLQTLDSDILRDLANRVELQFLQIVPAGTHPLTQEDPQQSPANSLEKFVSQTIPPPQELQQRALLAQPITQPTLQNVTQAPLEKQSPTELRRAMTELFIACPPNELTLLEFQWSINTLTQSSLIDHAYLMLRGRLPSDLEMETWNQSHLEQYVRADAIRRLTGAVANFEYADATN